MMRVFVIRSKPVHQAELWLDAHCPFLIDSALDLLQTLAHNESQISVY